ncbi:MAG: hypothetical protein NPIRA06_25370 [Nitrospirales bacterium]|nr:MAG: hypothetical protein NPIRA06_25370 [Nitrospirales bacterium]
MQIRAEYMWHMSLAGFLGVAIILGCAGSGIRTPIHKDEITRVYLEWVPQDSFRATHPAVLSPTVIRRALRGLRVQKQEPAVAELLAGLPEPQRILSDDDVELLTPHIHLALSQATSEEHVVFQRIYPWKYGSRMTSGTLSLHEDLIFLTITHYTPNPGGINFVYVDDRQAPDPTGLGGWTLLFLPKEVLRADTSPQAGRHPHEVTLAINYPSLKAWREPSEQPSLFQVQPTEESSVDVKPEIIPRESASEDNPIRALKEQVHRQQMEMEQLKKELRELQQSPKGKE